MPLRTPSSLLTLLLVLATLAATMGGAFGILRMLRRRARAEARRRTRELTRVVAAYLGGTCSEVDAAQAVHEADEHTFWNGLDAASPVQRLSDRRRLAVVLAHSPHVAAERRRLRHDAPWRQELAARRLGLVADRATRRALRRALVRGPELVTAAAARSLGHHGDLATLRWVLENPGALKRRSAAARVVLFRAFGRRALPRLTEALTAGVADGRMRRALTEAIGLGRHRPALPVIVRAAGDEDADVRVAAMRALGRMRAAGAADALLRGLRDEAWPVRAQAAWALGQAGVIEASEPLATALMDRTWWVRRHAAYALARLGQPGVDALRRVAAHGSDRYAREIALESLAIAVVADRSA
jgi:HEAT repeat protein